MKKMLILVMVLALCGIANAAVTWQVHSQTVTAGQLVTLNVINTDTTAGLFCMDVIATKSGGSSTISSVMDTDAGTYGWDYANYPDTPIITTNSAQFGGTQFNVNYNSIVGYLILQANSGTITINLTNGYDLGANDVLDGVNLEHIDVQDSATITVIPEPVTMALLGLGGLFLRRKK